MKTHGLAILFSLGFVGICWLESIIPGAGRITVLCLTLLKMVTLAGLFILK